MSKEIIYLRTIGGVIGYDLHYLNDAIDFFNRDNYLTEYCDFWEWFSYNEDIELRGISTLWTKDTSKLHTIKGGIHNV